MALTIKVHENKKVSESASDELEQIMAGADYEKRGLDLKKLNDLFATALDDGYTFKPFEATWGSTYFFYITYINRPNDEPPGAQVYLMLVKNEDTGESYGYLEFWDKNGNELCDEMNEVPLSDVFDAIKTIGK